MKKIWMAALLFAFSLTTVIPGFAVAPEMRLPEWYRLTARVLTWEPGNGVVKIGLDFQAIGIPVLDLSAGIIWPGGFGKSTADEKASRIEAGKEWKTAHKAKAPGNFDGWIEVAFSARPSGNELKRRVDGLSDLSEAAKEILRREAGLFKTPIPIGMPVALYLDNDIGIAMPKGFVCTPAFPMNLRALMLWSPNVVLGSGSTAAAYEDFKRALRAKDAASAVSSIGKLRDSLKACGDSIPLKGVGSTHLGSPPGGGIGEFQIKTSMVLDALKFNEISLSGLGNLLPAIAELEKLVLENPRSFLTGFIHANIGTLQASAGKKIDSEKSYREALKAIPAWPCVEGWLKGESSKLKEESSKLKGER